MITLCRDLDFIVRLQNRVKCFLALMGKLLFMENKTIRLRSIEKKFLYFC